MSTHYFLDQDNDCHWYLIPVDKRAEWNKWLDSAKRNVPKYARSVDGPQWVIFTNPEEVL